MSKKTAQRKRGKSGGQTPAKTSDSSRAAPQYGSHHGMLYHAGPALDLGARPLQRQVTIGRPDDRYEREADQVADHVVAGEAAPPISTIGAGGLDGIAARQPDSEVSEEDTVQTLSVQRMTAEPEQEQDKPLQRQVEDAAEPEAEDTMQTWPLQRQVEDAAEPEEDTVQTWPLQRQVEEAAEPEADTVQAWPLQRQVEEAAEPEAEDTVQTKPAPTSGGGASMQGAAANAISNAGVGRALSPPTRSALENSVGRDLGDVRVHDDSAAQDAARDLNARAFTHGSDIWLGRGESADDLRLMGHETAHVLQQTGSLHRKPVQRQIIQRSNGDAAAAPATRFTNNAGTIDTSARTLRIRRLRMPNMKARLLRGRSGPFRLRPNARADGSQQKRNWKNAIKSQSDAEVNALLERTSPHSPPGRRERIYYLKTRRGNYKLIDTPGKIRQRARIPNWDKSGEERTFDVDHVQELQTDGADTISNYWLWDASANRSSGSSINVEITRKIGALLRDARSRLGANTPAFDDVRNQYTVEFERFVPGLAISGAPREYWTEREIQSGQHIRRLTWMSTQEIEAAMGSETNLALFTTVRGGRMHRVQLPFTGPTHLYDNFTVNSLTYNDNNDTATDRGSLNGVAFQGNPYLEGQPMSLPIKKSSGVRYGGYIGAHNLLISLRSARFKGLSLIEFTEADLDAEKGIVARGRITPSINLIRNANIEIVVDGNDVYLSKTFDTGDFAFPGPLQVTSSSLTVSAGTRGLGIDGEALFEIERVGQGRVFGSASTGTGEGGSFELGGAFDFDSNLFDEARINVWYRENRFGGRGTLRINQGKLRGVRSAVVNVNLDGENWSADGTLEPAIRGIRSATLRASITQQQGLMVGATLTLGNDLPVITGGTLEAEVRQREGVTGYKVRATGDVPFSLPGGVTGNVNVVHDDGAFNARSTIAYRRGRIDGSVTVGVTNQAVGDTGQPAGPPTENYTVYGSGSVTIRITPWLQGTASVRLRPDGEIEIEGRIGVPDQVELFPEKSVNATLFSIGIDIPIVGVAVAGQRIGIFANISGSISLSAGIGPGVLRDTNIGIFYNPSREDQTRITGSATFAVPMHAGVRFAVSASLGVGIPIVSARLGLEIGAALGLQGEAAIGTQINWTPATGLAVTARGSIFVEPKFKFDITGFALVEADLLLTTITLYEKRWQLAALEIGSGMRMGASIEKTLREGEGFNISMDDVTLIYPEFDAARVRSILRSLVDRIS